MSIGLPAGFGALVAATLLLQRWPRRWPLVGIGAIAYGLGAAAILPEAALAADIPGSFGAVNAGLLLVAVALGVIAAVVAAREASSTALRAAAAIAGGVALLAIVPAIPYVMINGVGRALLVGLGIAAGGALALWLLRLARVARLFQWLDQRCLAPVATDGTAGWPGRWTAIGLLVVFTLAIGIAPRAVILVAWAVVLVLALHGLRRSYGPGRRWPIAAIGMAVLLGWVLRWLIPIAGGGWFVSFAEFLEAPVSSAAAVMLIPAVLAAGWLAAGLWPVNGLGAGPAGSFAAAFILAGLGRAMLGDGLVHASPLIGVALVLAAAHAAATDDGARYLAALGVLGVLGSTHQSDLLMQGVLALATIAGIWTWRPRSGRWNAVVWSVVGGCGAMAGFWIVSEALRVETLSSTLIAFSAVAMLARRV